MTLNGVLGSITKAAQGQQANNQQVVSVLTFYANGTGAGG